MNPRHPTGRRPRGLAPRPAGAAPVLPLPPSGTAPIPERRADRTTSIGQHEHGRPFVHPGRLDDAPALWSAGQLAEQGSVPRAVARRIAAALEQVRAEFAAGQIRLDPALEDVHTHVERRLGELVGRDAGYLHAGRSRNDQVALDERLFVVGACASTDAALVRLMRKDKEKFLAGVREGWASRQLHRAPAPRG